MMIDKDKSIIRRTSLLFLKIPILLLVIFSVLVTISIPAWRAKQLPNNNFVNIILARSVFIPCEDTDCDYPGEVLNLDGASASGVAIKTIKGKTYILTAYHFCNSDSQYAQYLDVDADVTISAIDNQGDAWLSYVVYIDEVSDLCLLESTMPPIDTIVIADQMPQRGERVYALSAPYGISSKDVVLQFEGFFSGCKDSLTCFFTLPATSGSSGSLIFNKDNEVVGMVQMSTVNFDNISIGPDSYTLRSFLENASIALAIPLV